MVVYKSYRIITKWYLIDELVALYDAGLESFQINPSIT